jgi:hypothetical protein
VVLTHAKQEPNMDEVVIARTLKALAVLAEKISDVDTKEALILVCAVLIEHNKSIQELVEAGDDY